MSAPPYMKLYWGDYSRKTRHLTRSQHGAYFLLLGALWDAGGRLSADDKTLARHALCSASEWAAMRPIIIAFFKIKRGWLTQDRVTEELAKYRDKIGKLKTAGKRGSEARLSKDRGNGAANAKQKPTYSESEVSIEPIKGSISNRRASAKARHHGAFAPLDPPDDTDPMVTLLAVLARQDEEAARAQADV